MPRPVRCATRCRCSTRRSPTARSTSSRSTALFGGTGFDLRDRAARRRRRRRRRRARWSGSSELLDAGHDPRRVTEDLLATARDTFLLTQREGTRARRCPGRPGRALAALGEQARRRRCWCARSRRSARRSSTCAVPTPPTRDSCSRSRSCGSPDATRVPPLQVLVERIERLERSIGSDASDSAASAPPAPPRPSRNLGAIRHERAARVVRRAHVGARTAATGTFATGIPQPAPAAEASAADASTPATAAAPRRRPMSTSTTSSLAWAEILPGLPPATRAAAREAQPLGIDDGVITFGVPERALASSANRVPQGSRRRSAPRSPSVWAAR